MTFVFRCRTCETVYEFDTREPDQTCCGDPLVRVYALGGIVLKGGGFYSTDHRD